MIDTFREFTEDGDEEVVNPANAEGSVTGELTTDFFTNEPYRSQTSIEQVEDEQEVKNDHQSSPTLFENNTEMEASADNND